MIVGSAMAKPLLWQQETRTPIGSGASFVMFLMVNLFLTAILQKKTRRRYISMYTEVALLVKTGGKITYSKRKESPKSANTARKRY